jgi:hypothetical protein
VRLLNQAPQAQLLAPDLVLVELLNAGWKAWRAGAMRWLKIARAA